MEQKGPIPCKDLLPQYKLNQRKQFNTLFFSLFQSAFTAHFVLGLRSTLFYLFQYCTPSFFPHSKQFSPFTCLFHSPLFLLSFTFFLFIGSVFPFEHFWSSSFRFSHTLSCHTGRPQKCRTVESVRGSGIPHAEGKHCTGQEGTQRSKQCTYPPLSYHTPLSTIISVSLTLGPLTTTRHFTALILTSFFTPFLTART